MVSSKKFTLLIGAYNTAITSIRFNPSSTHLTVLGTFDASPDPSWITTHPLDSSVLISTNDVKNVGGGVSTFKITDRVQGTAVRVDHASSYGVGPVFVAGLKKARQVAVMNYFGGNGAFIPLGRDLVTMDDKHTQKITFHANVTHPHQVVEYGDEILVPDLGADKIWRLTQKHSSRKGVPNWQVSGFVQQPIGSGPRHVLVSGGILYTLHELASTLSSQTLPPLGSGLKPKTISTVSVLPKGVNGSAFGAAELMIDEKRGLLYASNRYEGDLSGLDPRGDTIAIFTFDHAGKLKFVKQIYTGLNVIRAMIQGGPECEYIAAAGQTDGGLIVFEKVDGGRDLVARARLPDGILLAPTSIVWL